MRITANWPRVTIKDLLNDETGCVSILTKQTGNNESFFIYVSLSPFLDSLGPGCLPIPGPSDKEDLRFNHLLHILLPIEGSVIGEPAELGLQDSGCDSGSSQGFRCSRIFQMTPSYSMNAMIRIGPEHSGQSSGLTS